MSALVTYISPEELADLQAAMNSPVNVDVLHKEFPEAVKPANYLDPKTGKGTDVCTRGLSTMGEWPPGTRRVPVEGGGERVYHQDPDRYEKAKASQPEPGEKPQDVGLKPFGRILRMEDGSMVLHTSGCCPTHDRYRRLPDEPAAP